MKRLSMWIAVLLVTSIARVAFARDERPTTVDELRAVSVRGADDSLSAPDMACGRMPTTTDEARALAGAQLSRATALASRAAKADRPNRTPTTTDEARALAAARTNGPLVASSGGHGDACGTSCPCKRAEEHASNQTVPCACHG